MNKVLSVRRNYDTDFRHWQNHPMHEGEKPMVHSDNTSKMSTCRIKALGWHGTIDREEQRLGSNCPEIFQPNTGEPVNFDFFQLGYSILGKERPKTVYGDQFQENLLKFTNQHDKHLHFLGQNLDSRPWTIKDKAGVQMMPSSSPKCLLLFWLTPKTFVTQLWERTVYQALIHIILCGRPCTQKLAAWVMWAHWPGFPNKARKSSNFPIILKEGGKTHFNSNVQIC